MLIGPSTTARNPFDMPRDARQARNRTDLLARLAFAPDGSAGRRFEHSSHHAVCAFPSGIFPSWVPPDEVFMKALFPSDKVRKDLQSSGLANHDSHGHQLRHPPLANLIIFLIVSLGCSHASCSHGSRQAHSGPARFTGLTFSSTKIRPPKCLATIRSLTFYAGCARSLTLLPATNLEERPRVAGR